MLARVRLESALRQTQRCSRHSPTGGLEQLGSGAEAEFLSEDLKCGYDYHVLVCELLHVLFIVARARSMYPRCELLHILASMCWPFA